VRAVLSWADCDVIQKVDAPRKSDKLPTPVRPDDLKRITEEVGREYRELRKRSQCRPGELIWTIPVFRWAFYTGMRATEIGRLRWCDIDLDRGLIRIMRQKNNREQTIPLISKAKSVLDNAPERQGARSYVFRTPNGPIHDRNSKSFGQRASKRFCKARRDAGIERSLTFHDLRAGFATALADAGMSAHMIKEAMRHADLSTALKYVNVSRNRLRDEMESAMR
jgi:integrase